MGLGGSAHAFCRLCGRRSDFIKAHCIPEAFFRELRQGDRAPLIVADRARNPVGRAPIGVYDARILCRTCEESFGVVDAYGVQVLLQRFEELFKPVYRGDRLVAWESEAVDCPLLLRFLVAVIWRASVSTQPFYARVQMGPHEEVARSMLLDPAARPPGRFDAVFSRWAETASEVDLTTSIMGPHRERFSSVNGYRLYLGRVIAYVKVDAMPSKPPMSTLSLQAGRGCYLIRRDMATSKDYDVMKATALAAHRRQLELQDLRGRRARGTGRVPESET